LQEISQTDYPRRMRLKYMPTSALVVWLLFATSARAQDNPLEDPDLQQLLKQAQEMQKNARDLQKSPGSPDTRKNLAEMEAMAKEQAAQQEQEEKDEKEKLQAALKKQLEAPGPVAFPDWTPVTPEFKPAGKPTKKLVDEEVKIVQTGTSSLTPEQLADNWESATVVKEKNLSRGRNNLNVNGKITRILSLSTQTDPVGKVELEASREPNSKVTQVEILSPTEAENRERIESYATPHRWLSC
jgi:hypothetical protein